VQLAMAMERERKQPTGGNKSSKKEIFSNQILCILDSFPASGF
jgi:hypothetical protein